MATGEDFGDTFKAFMKLIQKGGAEYLSLSLLVSSMGRVGVQFAPLQDLARSYPAIFPTTTESWSQSYSDLDDLVDRTATLDDRVAGMTGDLNRGARQPVSKVSPSQYRHRGRLEDQGADNATEIARLKRTMAFKPEFDNGAMFRNAGKGSPAFRVSTASMRVCQAFALAESTGEPNMLHLYPQRALSILGFRDAQEYSSAVKLAKPNNDQIGQLVDALAEIDLRTLVGHISRPGTDVQGHPTRPLLVGRTYGDYRIA